MSDWIGLPEELTKDDHYAIVYKVTNLVNNRMYIGKKLLWSPKYKVDKKTKKRKKIYGKSDYEKYYGSSKELLGDILIHGKENFKREVLAIVKNKWEASYVELYFQLTENVLFSDDYYNNIINIRLNGNLKDKELCKQYLFKK